MHEDNVFMAERAAIDSVLARVERSSAKA